MLHHRPSPQDLNEHLAHLKSDYTHAKKEIANTQRKKLINLIGSFQEKIESKYSHLAALGICLYGLHKIKAEVRLSLFQSEENSQLFRILKKSLNIHTLDEISAFAAVVYLNALIEHLKLYPRDENGDRCAAEKTLSLIKQIETYIKLYLATLLKKQPSFKSLQKQFINIPQEYKPCALFFGWKKRDATRMYDIQRLKIIDILMEQMFNGEHRTEKNQEKVYKIRFGTLLFIMARIEASYAGWNYLPQLWSAENSALYRLCQATTCLKSVGSLNEKTRDEYFYEYLNFITTAQNTQAWRSANLESAEEIYKLWAKSVEQAYLRWLFFYILNYGVKYGVKIMVGSAATAFFTKFHVGSIIIARAGQLLAPEYAFLIKKLTAVLGEQINASVISIISGAVTNLIVEPLGTPLFVITFKNLKSLTNCLMSIITSKKDNGGEKGEAFPEFYSALEGLPAHIITKEEQEKIKYIMGYELVTQGEEVPSKFKKNI